MSHHYYTNNTPHHLLFFILLFFLSLLHTPPASAVPAYPHPVEYTQPDGRVITIQLKGDERINWAETPDGYTILANRDGFYEYAGLDEAGDLVLSGRRVSPVTTRDQEERRFLEQLDRGLFFSDRQVDMMREVWKMREEAAARSFPSTGEQTLIAILMETADVPFQKTQEDFDALFNQIGYSFDGASGSVKEYYLENSYGLFDLSVDVAGPYTAEHDMAHYGATWSGARQLATEAVHLADPDVDYADYDNSGNGWVDGVYMIFAGYGEEAGGGPNTIWSHAWSIDPVQLDGVWISRYACSPELRGNSGTNITRIGVIGHEFGHILGAPDYYDTDGDGSGGSFTGTGSWDMMAGGTWNNGGATPAHHNAYTKTYTYGWATPMILNQTDTVTMLNSVEHSEHFYRLNTNTPGEYYLLENRHHISFDTHIPGEGMIIYHVHKEVATSGNEVNVGHPQKMYPVSAGANTDPTGPPWSYGNINSAQTPFPGSSNQTSFTDSSTPGALSWSGDLTQKPITQITRDGENQSVTFFFMEDSGASFDWVHWDDGIHEGHVGIGGGGVYQIAHRYEPEDLLPYEGFQVNRLRLHMGNEPTEAALKIWQGENQDSLVEVVHQEFTPEEQTWVEINLDEPHLIDTGKELWIGVEYDDPGEGVFTASRDAVTDHDGKGNLIRMDVDDPEAWTSLSEFDIDGDWNIQARIGLSNHLMVHFAAENGHGDIHAFANGHEIDPGSSVPEGADILFQAHPDEGFDILHWTVNGEAWEDHATDSLHIPNLEKNLEVTVTFDTIRHQVDFYVDGNHGSLEAHAGDTPIHPGDEVQQGADVFFTALPDPGFRVEAWYHHGTPVEDLTENHFEILAIDEDATVSVSFEEAVNTGDLADPGIKAYPNPATDHIYLEAGVVIGHWQLLDIRGQIVDEAQVNARKTILNLENIRPGSYLLLIETDGASTHKRIQVINQ